MSDRKFLTRCLQLAAYGRGKTYPNPLVGAVIVHNGVIIGEGFHKKCGKAHAEVEAINSVKDRSLLTTSVLYVSLEPCAHFGKTPPCSLLITQTGIPEVVIGCIDPHDKVAGKGIAHLESHGVKVRCAQNPQPFEALNKVFFVNKTMQRPFIALKWAESSDGFIDGIRNSTNKRPTLISAPLSRVITHRLRSVYDGILISGKTAALDLPSLTTRYYHGNHPVPIVLDSKEFPLSVEWLNSLSKKPIIVSERNYEGACQIQCDPSKINVWLPQLLSDFSICSILVEGGAAVLQSIIDQDVVDEMHILRSSIELGEGVRAPFVKDARTNSRTILFGSDVYERR